MPDIPSACVSASVLVPIAGPTLLLLIREPRKPKPVMWKPVSESFERGDTVLDAIVRGLAEEAGCTDLQFEIGADRHIARVVDPRVRLVELDRPQVVSSRHVRHFWGVLASDEFVQSLSGKELRPHTGELIFTKAFPHQALENQRMFSDHKAIIRRLLGLLVPA